MHSPDTARGVRVSFFSLPVAGHVTPALPVIRALRDRGASVEVCTTEAFRESHEAVGASTATYPAAFASQIVEPPDDFFAVAALLAKLTNETMLGAAMDHLRARRPDVVVVDSMAPWGRLAAQRMGIPVATSTASFLISLRAAASPRAAADTAWRASRARASLREIAVARRALRTVFGVDCGGPMQLLSNRGDATLVYTSRGFQPGGRSAAPDVHFVGPTATTRAQTVLASGDPLASLLEQARGGARLAYVSLGTLYNARPAFLQSAIDALSAAGWLVVVSTGDGVDPSGFGALPTGVVVQSAPPQLAVLDVASLFVTHAGLNSVHEALWRGVPMLMFPQAGDQLLVASRVAARGAGRILRGREPDREQIARQASALMARGSAARAAAKIGAELRGTGGAPEAARLILSLGESS